MTFKELVELYKELFLKGCELTREEVSYVTDDRDCIEEIEITLTAEREKFCFRYNKNEEGEMFELLAELTRCFDFSFYLEGCLNDLKIFVKGDD